MYRKYMVDSVVYWATEYHLDGFRFDLMGLHDTETMKAIREALDELPNGKDIIIYGEPWIAGPTAMEEGYITSVTANEEFIPDRVDIFSDSIRDAIKGSVFIKEVPAYINSKDEDSVEFVEKLKEALVMKNRVTYASAHDNFSLYDKLVLSTDVVDKNDTAHMYDRNDLLAEMNKMSAGIVFTANGMAFFQAGEEFLRTKQGIEDSYNSPISINKLDWKRAYENRDIIEYYKKLISIRKRYSCLSNIDRTAKYEFVNVCDMDNVIAFTINNELLVIYNPNTSDIEIDNHGYNNIVLSEMNSANIVKAKSVTILAV
jgi:pullulanase